MGEDVVEHRAGERANRPLDRLEAARVVVDRALGAPASARCRAPTRPRRRPTAAILGRVMFSPPRISVVIAVLNGARTLQRALDSVFEQTYANVELVVIDGASTDGTAPILERNAARIAYWESEPDRGIFHAWNKALDHVTGDWICFLGSDDRYHSPIVMANVAAALAKDGGRHRIAHGTIDWIREDGSVDRSMGVPWDEARRMRFRHGVMIPHPATFHHRTLFELHGRFDERFRIAGDYEFLLRELLDHDPLFIPELVVDMAVGGISDRPSSRSTVIREAYRARYMHGLETVPAWRSGPLIRKRVRLWATRRLGRNAVQRLEDIYRFILRKPRRRR